MSQPTQIAIPSREPPGHPLTFDEFHDWCDRRTRAEWVDGEVLVMSPNSMRDHRILHFLITILTVWIDVRGLGKLHGDQILMRLPPPVRAARMPDLLFVARTHADRTRPTYLDGAADVVVEIISPDSVDRDRRKKFEEYQRAGVPEYWLIDGVREEAEFYLLGADGSFQLVFKGNSGIYRSPTLDGFPLDLGWLWQDPAPSTPLVLKQLGVFPL